MNPRPLAGEGGTRVAEGEAAGALALIGNRRKTLNPPHPPAKAAGPSLYRKRAREGPPLWAGEGEGDLCLCVRFKSKPKPLRPSPPLRGSLPLPQAGEGHELGPCLKFHPRRTPRSAGSLNRYTPPNRCGCIGLWAKGVSCAGPVQQCPDRAAQDPFLVGATMSGNGGC